MPLNITQTDTLPTIPGLIVQQVPPPTTEEEPAPFAAQHEPPPPLPPEFKAELPPVIAVGVKLAYFVLAITAGSIAALILYLAWMDSVIGSDIHATYEQILNPSRIGAEFYTLGRLEKLSLDLNSARMDPNWQMPQVSLQNAESIMGMLKQLPSLTSTEKAQLADCVPPPPATVPAPAPIAPAAIPRSTSRDKKKPAPPPIGPAVNAPSASRNEKLNSCIGIIEDVRRAALEAAASVTNAQVAADSATKLNEDRQSLHSFWVQAAQLILLNLLLPLLTALFGYIFGTQQAQRQG